MTISFRSQKPHCRELGAVVVVNCVRTTMSGLESRRRWGRTGNNEVNKARRSRFCQVASGRLRIRPDRVYDISSGNEQILNTIKQPMEIIYKSGFHPAVA